MSRENKKLKKEYFNEKQIIDHGKCSAYSSSSNGMDFLQFVRIFGSRSDFDFDWPVNGLSYRVYQFRGELNDSQKYFRS